MSKTEIEVSYVPFGAQVRAHQAKEDTVLLAGGWGSGKTSWLLAEALRNTVINPGLAGILVSPTFPLQRRTLYRAIVDFFPGAKMWPTGGANARDCLGPLVRDWSSRDRVLTLYNGSQWIFGSADQPGAWREPHTHGDAWTSRGSFGMRPGASSTRASETTDRRSSGGPWRASPRWDGCSRSGASQRPTG